MTNKIRVSFHGEGAADRFIARLKAERPKGYTSATQCQYKNHPTVFVFGEFSEEQEAAIRKMRTSR